MPDEHSLGRPWTPDQWDMNGDSALTVADALPWLREAYFLPGDWSIWWVAEHQPRIAAFLLVDASSYGSLFSGLLSALLWLTGLLVLMIAVRSLKRFDEALTHRIRIVYDDIARRLRVLRLELARIVRRGKPRDSSDRIELTEGIDLSGPQRQLLKVLLDVPAPYALSIAEIANRQNLSRREANGIIRALRSLNFVSSVGSGAYEEQAFTITTAGRAFLMFNRLNPRRA